MSKNNTCVQGKSPNSVVPISLSEVDTTLSLIGEEWEFNEGCVPSSVISGLHFNLLSLVSSRSEQC